MDNSNPDKKNETKHDKFKRLATQRVNRAIELINRIENLSNTNNYNYDEEDARKIINALEVALKQLRSSFSSNSKKNKFKL